MSYDFASFARLHGLDLLSVEPSTRIRRCGTEDKPRSKNGAYWFDGERGWIQRWDQGGELVWWDDPDKPPLTPEQRAEWARKQREYERKQAAYWGAAALRCRMLQEQTVVTEHNYMHRKGLGDIKVSVLPAFEQVNQDTGEIETIENSLFVPMINFESEAMVGAQLIYWQMDELEWKKKFVPGSRLKNSAYRMGSARCNELVLCEGFATGHSILMALQEMRLRATILCCFNDSNMVNIAEQLPPGIRAYVFADNDKSRAGVLAAQRTKLPYCMSPNVGEDANDLHQSSGLFAVQKLIMEARRIRATAPSI